jgi:pyrroloquinoline quinone (PQQ) biosynthesis protein C
MTQPIYGHHLEAAIRTKFAQADRLWAEIGHVRAEWDFPRHPFLQRWSAGELTAAELQVYAGEQHHAVVALASASRRAATLADGMLAEELTRLADDQEDYLDLWCEFAVATGWGGSSWHFGEDPFPQTIACARAWSGQNRSLDRHLVSIYAIESVLAQTSPLQLDALISRYGFDARSVRYFTLRAERTAGDGALTQAALTSLLPLPCRLHLVGQTELTYRSYWELLDGVQGFSGASL